MTETTPETQQEQQPEARKPTILPIFAYPNDDLFATRFEGEPDDPEALGMDMGLTMLVNRGVGLAGPQVAAKSRIITVLSKGGITIAVDPIIEDFGDETTYEREGCLSLPGVEFPVRRFREITVYYKDEAGLDIREAVDGLEARIFQHEIDHLNGVFFLDYLSDWRRKEVLAKQKKILTKLWKKAAAR